MFSVDTQKQASSIAFQHDAAPRLLIEHLWDLEKQQVVLDLMTALKKLERPGVRLRILICGLHDIALSHVGFVRLLDSEFLVLRDIKTLTSADILRVSDLEQAKLDLHTRIVEFTADFSRYQTDVRIMQPVTYTTLEGSRSQAVDTKTDDKVKQYCCFVYHG